MSLIAKTTAKLAISAVLAVLVTGMFGSAIGASSTASPAHAGSGSALHLARAAGAVDGTVHHCG
ncbi:MAG TPA: hypothetical protein VMI92_08595 [Steroidobacteraceae bacterium]|nr:hypothetical protein [Steroidobacteraceae bacterium]